MATATQLKDVGNAITGMTSAISNTFVEQAHAIAEAGHNAWGGSLDIKDADITTVVKQVTDNATWKGTTSEKARQSEVKAICKAYTFIETGSRVFKREYGELRREHFVKLARMCPEYATATDAALDCVDYFQTRKVGNKQKPAEKLASAMSSAINVARELKNDALANSLTNLARKHAVKVK